MAVELKEKVEGLKTKVSETKKASIANFKKSDAYKSDLNTTTTRFFTSERIKMKRLLRKLYQIKDMSFLDKVAKEATFSNARDDEKKEEGEEITQEDPLRVPFQHKCRGL